MPLWTELLRSVPLPTASLFLKKRDIANGSLQLNFDVGLNFAYNDIEAIWEKYREWYLNEEGKLNEKRRSFWEKPSRLGFSNPF